MYIVPVVVLSVMSGSLSPAVHFLGPRNLVVLDFIFNKFLLNQIFSNAQIIYNSYLLKLSLLNHVRICRLKCWQSGGRSVVALSLSVTHLILIFPSLDYLVKTIPINYLATHQNFSA